MTKPAPAFGILQMVPLAEIYSEDRLRRIDRGWVEGLATLIRENGLEVPIQVSPQSARDAKRTGCRYVLAAGKHRIEAVKLLNWTEIPSIIGDRNSLQIRLAEIDENLIRRELTAWDRAVFLSEREVVYQAMHPETKRGEKGRQVIDNSHTANLAVWAAAFSEDVAERMGMGSRSVRRAVSIVRRISPDLRSLIPDLPIADNQTELEALSKREPGDQVRIVEAIARAEKPAASVRAAVAEIEGRPTGPKAPNDAQFDKLWEAWNRAAAKARQRFLQHLRDTGQLGGDA